MAELWVQGKPVTTRVDYGSVPQNETLAVNSEDAGTAHEQIFFYARPARASRSPSTVSGTPAGRSWLLDGKDGRRGRCSFPRGGARGRALARVVVPIPQGEGYLLLRFEDTPLRRSQVGHLCHGRFLAGGRDGLVGCRAARRGRRKAEARVGRDSGPSSVTRWGEESTCVIIYVVSSALRSWERSHLPPPRRRPHGPASTMNAGLLAKMFGVQLPLMIGLPILLGWWIRRRYGIGWGVFALGALTFVLSWVVHLPLRALGLLGGGRGVALWPLVPMALIARLSGIGICEEALRSVGPPLPGAPRPWLARPAIRRGHGGLKRSSSASWPRSQRRQRCWRLRRSMGMPDRAVAAPRCGSADEAAQAAFWSTSPLLPSSEASMRVFAIIAADRDGGVGGLLHDAPAARSSSWPPSRCTRSSTSGRSLA